MRLLHKFKSPESKTKWLQILHVGRRGGGGKCKEVKWTMRKMMRVREEKNEGREDNKEKRNGVTNKKE